MRGVFHRPLQGWLNPEIQIVLDGGPDDHAIQENQDPKFNNPTTDLP